MNGMTPGPPHITIPYPSASDLSSGPSGAVGPQKTGPAQNVLFYFTLKLAANNVPQQCPPYAVPDGAQVQVTALAGNGKTIYAATYRGAFAPGNALPLSASFATVFSVSNLANIWGYGNALDSLIVTVTKGA